jgi:hypothetical protein
MPAELAAHNKRLPQSSIARSKAEARSLNPEQLGWFLQLSPSRARQMLQFPDPRRSDDAPYVSLELAASAVVDAEGTSETALAVLAADLAGNLLKIKAVRRSQARDIDFRRGGKQGRAGGAPSLRLAWPLRGEAQAPNHRPR